MLVEKEIIAPGTYFYVDVTTGLPRKLEVTPDLTKYWHEQGGKMLGAGLTVPVPFEHDFNSHPMTPKDKLLNNSGWVKEYRLKDAPDGRKNVLFGVLDIQDEGIARKLPRTIRWTSPWINSFTDGQGTKWNNVISHLALTTRPRITKQAPFGSIAAALSMATEVKTDPAIIAGEWTPRFDATDKGLCLSRAGRIGLNNQPDYPIAFSMLSGMFATETELDSESPDFHKEAHEATKAASGATEALINRRSVRKREQNAQRASTRAHVASLAGNHEEASRAHVEAAGHHEAIVEHAEDEGRVGVSRGSPSAGGRGNTEWAENHKRAAAAHKEAAGIHHDVGIDKGTSWAVEDEASPKKKKQTDETEGMDPADDIAVGKEGGGELLGEQSPDPSGMGDVSGLMNPLQDSVGDVKMEELLCDLLSALGVQMPENVGEAEFKRVLYEATMGKVKELASAGQAATQQGSPQNTTSPAGGSQQNSLIQQEQQPMYMSLEEIQKITNPTMKTIALSMYTENQKLRAEVEASKKVTDSLRDAKIREAAALRQQRITLLGKVSPRVKVDLDAMLAMPSMALSMGDGGTVVDPMAQTLAILEKGLADIPKLLTTDAAALSVQSHPTDATNEMTEERANEIIERQVRMMGGAAEQKKAS